MYPMHFQPDHAPFTDYYKWKSLPHYRDTSANGVWYANNTRPVLPPDQTRIAKGSFGATLPRSAVEFAFTSARAQRLYAFMAHTYIPDELFWSTLVHNFANESWSFPAHCRLEYERRRMHKRWIT